MEKKRTSQPEELDDFVRRMRDATREAANRAEHLPSASEAEASLHPPGPLEDEKRADDPGLGDVEPQAAEVESARLLVSAARPELEGAGLSEEQLRRLADDFIARDRGEDLDSFMDWSRDRARHHGGEPPRP